MYIVVYVRSLRARVERNITVTRDILIHIGLRNIKLKSPSTQSHTVEAQKTVCGGGCTVLFVCGGRPRTGTGTGGLQPEVSGGSSFKPARSAVPEESSAKREEMPRLMLLKL